MHTILILLFSLESSQINSLKQIIWVLLMWLCILVIYKPNKRVLRFIAQLGTVEIAMFGLMLFSPGPPLIFVGPVAITQSGLRLFFTTLLRWFFSASALITVVERVGFHTIIDELIDLKLPETLIIILLFTYRYISVLMEELIYSLRSIKMRNLSLNIFTQEGRKIASMVIFHVFNNAYKRYRFISLSIENRGAIYMKGLRNIQAMNISKLLTTLLTLTISGGLLLWLI